MKKEFFRQIELIMRENLFVYLVSADMGFGGFDFISKKYPQRCINVGSSEQAGMDICVGLALSGKIPFFYSITPFAILRPFETIRTYINYEQIPVIIVGSGCGKDYLREGISHWATDIEDILRPLSNIRIYKPKEIEEIPSLMREIINKKRSCVILLRRE